MPNGLPAELLECQKTLSAEYFSGKDYDARTTRFSSRRAVLSIDQLLLAMWSENRGNFESVCDGSS